MTPPAPRGSARFTGKAAIVTGGARGIGYAIAERLRAEGARILLFDLDSDLAREAAQALSPDRNTVDSIGGDVSQRDDVRRAVALCIERFGGLDVMVAHAGIADAQHLLDISDHDWRRMLEVNLTGVFLCVQEAARVMARAHRGAIVATSSTNAFWVESNLAHYNTSKGGVATFVRSAAIDLAPLGIRVNGVAPGVIRTRISAWVTDDAGRAADYLKQIPLKRFGEPDDVARAVLFLASDDAAYITGQTLVVDGGQTLGVTVEAPDAPLPGSARAGEHEEEGG